MIDLTNIPASFSELLPDGDYQLTVVESALKSTKSGGEMIVLTFETEEGRKIFHRFNVKNASEKAQMIGLSQLKAFLKAAGGNTEQLSSPDELLGLKVTAKVGSEHRPPYSAVNKILKFTPASMF